MLESTDSYVTQTLSYLVVLLLIQKQTHLFLTQPLTIFYPLKDSKTLFFKNLVFSYAIYLILSDLLLFVVVVVVLLFFVFPGTLIFFLVYCVILYINIFIYKKKEKKLRRDF